MQIPDNQELRVVHKGDTIEVVKSFCYLGDCIGERGGCYEVMFIMPVFVALCCMPAKLGLSQTITSGALRETI